MASELKSDPEVPLRLQQALAQALQHNPELAAYSEEIRAREAEALQAGFRPNPLLSFEAENVFGSGDFSGTDAAETTVSLSQAIELGNKRSRRRELAEAETTLAQSDYAVAKADIFAKTADSFIAVLAAQERLQLAAELATLAKQVLGTVEERIAAGKAAATESVRARMQWRELEVTREKARRDLAAARRTLAAHMGFAAADFGTAAGDLSRMADPPELTDLERLITDGPSISRRAADTERRRRAVALESARRFPDLEVGLGVRNLRESDDNALVLGVAIPLPVFNRNQGAVAAAGNRLDQARAEERNALLQTKATLNATWQEMATAREEAEVLGKEILPAARQTLETAEYGYRAGKFGILDVLDAQRTLVEAQGRHLDALATFHRASNELNRLLGRELPESSNPATVSAAAKE
jgi:cobalt-zinc-cadmium efflux system outer membrane protein